MAEDYTAGTESAIMKLRNQLSQYEAIGQFQEDSLLDKLLKVPGKKGANLTQHTRYMFYEAKLKKADIKIMNSLLDIYEKISNSRYKDPEFYEKAQPVTVDFLGYGFKINSSIEFDRGSACSSCGSGSGCG